MSFDRTRMPDSPGSFATGVFSRYGIALVLACLILSSCSPSSPFSSQPAAPAAAAGTALEPISVPPGAGERAPLPGQSGRPYGTDGLPALQPARNVNLEELFAADIRDPVERIRRTENAVIELRRDFEAVLPAIVRLTALEKDIQELVVQLEELLRNEPPPAVPGVAYGQAPLQGAGSPVTAPEPLLRPPQQMAGAPPGTGAGPAPAPQAAMSPPPQTTPPPASGRFTVRQLRLGEHSDKTRIVLDVSGPATYRYDLDNEENILVIELPEAGWSGATQWQAKGKSPIIASYNVHAMNGGSRVVMQLKQKTAIVYESVIRPDGSKDHRIVIDLRK